MWYDSWIEWFVVALHTVLALIASGHALLFKRDSRAALGWIAVCLTFPLIGSLLYFIFGINRVKTRAKKLRGLARFKIRIGYERPEDSDQPHSLEALVPARFRQIARVSEAVTRRPLVGGNSIEMLHNGEQAYPRMLEAIDGANHTVLLSTYIFETNETGRRFIAALANARRRGVDVKVILDGVGELYSLPRAGAKLKKKGVAVARFLPPRLLPPSLHINLRNHRKILIVDNTVGFTGGMNIGDRHLADDNSNPSRVVDVHFRVKGPVVAHMARTFMEDWNFITGDDILLPPADTAERGTAICRTITDGPNEDIDKLVQILAGAVSAAQSRVYLVTPYFLPSHEMIGALQSAALRGVEVILILPRKNNQPLVHWATRNILWELLICGIHVYYQPPPFVHTKLFLVDHYYAQIGSANIDPRSLRLNFELVLEVFDESFANTIVAYVDAIRAKSKSVSLEEMDGRPLPLRIRDALAWLFSPYL